MATTGQEGDDIDHYEVLCLPSGEEGAALSIEQIEKAYRTQSRLRHPDKRPDDPNATADFQSLASSYKFLRDESLRRQLDARLRGRREAAARAAASGVKRRKAVSDLEERERAFAAGGGPAVDPAEAAKREDKRKAADVKRELDEFFAAKKSAASGSASTSVRVWVRCLTIPRVLFNSIVSSRRISIAIAAFWDHERWGICKFGDILQPLEARGDKKGGNPENEVKTDKGKILKVSWEGGADYYTAAKLEEIFKQFGKVEDIVIKTRKSRSRGSAIVVMGSKEEAQSARQNHSVYNVFSVPLIVSPVEESNGLPARSTQTPEPRTSNIEGTGFSDLEASVFRKLQEAQKRKQCG